MSRLNPRQAAEVVSVGTLAQTGSWGSTPGPDVPVRVAYLAKRQLVRDKDGVEVVSQATLLAAPEHNRDVADLEALFTPGTTVTVRGEPREVIGSAPATTRGRLVYVNVTLT